MAIAIETCARRRPVTSAAIPFTGRQIRVGDDGAFAVGGQWVTGRVDALFLREAVLFARVMTLDGFRRLVRLG